MASADTEAPSRHHFDNRSPSPIDRHQSPSLRRDRSPSPGSRDISPPPRDRSRTRSPPRRRSPPPPRARRDADRYRPAKKERTPPPAPPPKTEEEKLADARAEYQKLLSLRSQGVYMPPHKLRALQAAITDRSTKEYQRMAWDALKKSINGLVNKVNTANIKFVVPELFNENLERGRGLLCQSLLKAQHASLPFTPIYACLVAICNTKMPRVGELLVKRLIMRFRKGFKRNDKAVCLSSTMFLAHLVNYQVVNERLAGQILVLLLQRPTNDSVEIAVGFMREVGLFLEEMSPGIAHAVFETFRNVLHEADIDNRAQYMIEVLFQVRKDKYKDNPVIKEELDLIDEEDQIMHQILLDDEINTEDSLNVFKYDPDWEAHEEEYKTLKAEILGEGSDDEGEEDESESETEEEDEEEKALEIKDQSNADLVNLRRTIYLTIQSSADPEEAAHKLMKLKLPVGQEPELVSMIVESCAQEKVYLKFMGLLGERFARLNRMWMDLFEESFMKYYTTIHRYETNKLRNIARFFGHLLASDAIGWHVLSVIHLNEEETTSASRIFIKILFEDLQENLGTAKLKARMSDETLQPSLQGIFPHDNPRNIRFSINYLTAIKMGFLTDEMRTFLANMPKPTLPAPAAASDSDSVSSYSSYTRSSYSSRSRSRTPRRAVDRGRSISRTPPRRGRDRSYTRSRTRSRSYTRSVSTGRSLSRSPAPRRARGRSPSRTPSRSRSPERGRGRGRSRSYTRSPTPRSVSRSRSPPPARRGRARTRSPSYSRSPSRSRSPVAGPSYSKRRREDSYSASRSPPPPPARRQRRYSSRSKSPLSGDSRSPSKSRARSRTRSPAPAAGAAARDGRGDDRGRGARNYSSRSYSRSMSRSRSPPPSRGGAGKDGGYSGSYADKGGDGYRGGGYRDRDGYGRGRRDSRSRSGSPARSPAGGAGGGKRRRYYSSSRSRSPRVPAKRGRVGA